jgi:hypothetical protein
MAGIGFGTNFNNDNYAVRAGNGLGSTTYVCSVATGTVTVEAACLEIQNEGGTIAAVEGLADGNHIAVQGGPTPAVTGVTVVATFTAEH